MNTAEGSVFNRHHRVRFQSALTIALSLWYATLFVVIEGWREVGLKDPELDVLFADTKAEALRRFRNQVFHFQHEYDNRKLLEFLGSSDADAHAACLPALICYPGHFIEPYLKPMEYSLAIEAGCRWVL